MSAIRALASSRSPLEVLTLDREPREAGQSYYAAYRKQRELAALCDECGRPLVCEAEG